MPRDNSRCSDMKNCLVCYLLPPAVSDFPAQTAVTQQKRVRLSAFSPMALWTQNPIQRPWFPAAEELVV